MDMKLELVPLPVSNPDESLAFYRDKVGFHLDHDVRPGNGMRIIQLTPPGSACSIAFGSGMNSNEPGSISGLHLVVKNITSAREQLISRGVEVGTINDWGGGVKSAGFADPDGNSWELQEIQPRT